MRSLFTSLATVLLLGCAATPPSKTGPPSAAAPTEPPKSFAAPPPAGTRARCPVMGEAFTVDASTARAEHKGKHFVFCCPPCKGKFTADPEKFAP